MGSIVIAMPKQDDAKRLSNVIRQSGIWEEVVICSRGSQAIRIVSQQDVSIVVCPKQVGDIGHEELASYLPSHVRMILLTKDPGITSGSDRILKLKVPFKGSDLIDTIRTLLPSGFYSRKRKKPARPPEEQRMIDKAKFLLMNRNEMTEPEAFRYIQKTSMDTGRSLAETAQMILMLGGD